MSISTYLQLASKVAWLLFGLFARLPKNCTSRPHVTSRCARLSHSERTAGVQETVSTVMSRETFHYWTLPNDLIQVTYREGAILSEEAYFIRSVQMSMQESAASVCLCLVVLSARLLYLYNGESFPLPVIPLSTQTPCSGTAPTFVSAWCTH